MEFKTIFKWLGYALGTVIVGFYAYCKLTYIDQEITQGEGFGFKIGQSKEAVFDTAKTFYKEDTFWAPLERGKSMKARKKIRFTDKEFNEIVSYDEWTFANHEWKADFIDLKFEGGQLVSIWRFRRKCEGL